jgi:hypothetical protein
LLRPFHLFNDAVAISDYVYSSSLSLTSALDGVDGQRHVPAPLPPGKKPGTHCIGAWVGSRAVWTGGENIAQLEFVPRPVLAVANRYTN